MLSRNEWSVIVPRVGSPYARVAVFVGEYLRDVIYSDMVEVLCAELHARNFTIAGCVECYSELECAKEQYKQKQAVGVTY